MFGTYFNPFSLQVKSDAKKVFENLKEKKEKLSAALAEKQNMIENLEKELKSVQNTAHRTLSLIMETDVEYGWPKRDPESPGAEDASNACTPYHSSVSIKSDEDTVLHTASQFPLSTEQVSIDGDSGLHTALKKAVREDEAAAEKLDTGGVTTPKHQQSATILEESGREMNAGHANFIDKDSELVAELLAARQREAELVANVETVERMATSSARRAMEEQDRLKEGFRRAMQEAREQAREMQDALESILTCFEKLEQTLEGVAAAAASAVAAITSAAVVTTGQAEVQCEHQACMSCERLAAEAREAERRAATAAAEAVAAFEEEARRRKEEARAAARELARERKAWELEREQLDAAVHAAQESEGRSKDRLEVCREESRKAVDRAVADARRAEEREALLQARLDALSERGPPQAGLPPSAARFLHPFSPRLIHHSALRLCPKSFSLASEALGLRAGSDAQCRAVYSQERRSEANVWPLPV